MNDIIYLDLECLLQEYDSCSDAPNKSYTENVDKHNVCRYSTTIVRYHSNKKRTTYYRGKDSLSKLCKELHEEALILINTGKKSLTPLTD